jgi:NitT/TauT family transport system permease protein
MTTNSIAAVPMRSTAAPSNEYSAFLRRTRRNKRLVLACQVVLLVLFLGLWEVLPRAHVVNPMLTSYPSAIWAAFVELLRTGDLLHHTWATVFSTIIGFTLSMVIGVVVAAALWWSDFVYKVLDPFLVIGNALPKIALVPIFYIWLGSDYSIYGIAIAIAVFVAIMIIYAGFCAIDPNKIKLANTFGASRWQVLCKVVLPGSVPTLIAALKMNIGLALVGVVVGEFQSSNAGLGYLIINGSQIFKMNIVMASVTVLALISCVMYLAIHSLEAAISRRYG